MTENETTVLDTMKKNTDLKCQLEVLRRDFSLGDTMDDGHDTETTCTPRSASAKKRPRGISGSVIAAEISEVFTENDTSAPATIQDINCSMINDFDNEDTNVEYNRLIIDKCFDTNVIIS